MFNNTVTKVSSTVEVNACNGGIYKTYKESILRKFHVNSNLADKLFDSQPQMKDPKNGINKDIVVIQAVAICKEWLMAEIMWKEDFDKYFKEEEG